jgi:4-amino-4-deoxy-L-arabinose transferase-like glycosyltransferase
MSEHPSSAVWRAVSKQLARNRGSDPASDEKRFGAWLFAAVFASRAFTSSSAYFADANRHIMAVLNHSYVIEPPGYWLFNRTAGLFPDPEIAISVMNWCFSAAGAVVFYLTARRLARESIACLSSIAYATIFFAWHSGNVHSTYASQLFFPVAVFLCFLQYWEELRFRWILAAAVLFALGAGFRPSDGAFFAPAFLYGLSKGRRSHLLVTLVVVCLLCISWLIPQELGLLKQTIPIERNFSSHFGSTADGVLVVGFSPYALSNAMRVVVPFVLALFPLLSLIIGNRGRTFLWVWILPGMAFFLLVYTGEATYMNCVLAALVLLALTNPAVDDRKKLWRFVLCAVLNVAFYFAWRPIAFPNHTLQVAEYVIEADAGKFSYYGVRHHYEPRLSQLLHVQGYGEPAARSTRRHENETSRDH